jgi:hypothetical protein
MAGRAAGSTETANWSAGVGYSQSLTDTLGMEVGYQYLDGFSAAKGGTVKHAHVLEGALSWTPVTNFNVRLEGHWGQQRTIAGVKTNTADGFIWVRRSF